MILSWIIFTSPRHDHTDEQHRPCVASPFKSEQKRAVNNAQKGYIVEEGDFPERPVTRSGSESKLITMKVEIAFEFGPSMGMRPTMRKQSKSFLKETLEMPMEFSEVLDEEDSDHEETDNDINDLS
ncbi:hypothetical protein AVEN_161209-1 [Araneus ventricosus]|uniref:Uncharacterized protein n=1 Tax=Araneus ventricosus TaxID=182803 RepID=A0A4Y2MGV0_ARAVE|nr:hypothetical protein AVEN_161209-1 [Araneus ventricosus]